MNVEFKFTFLRINTNFIILHACNIYDIIMTALMLPYESLKFTVSHQRKSENSGTGKNPMRKYYSSTNRSVSKGECMFG